MTFNHHFKFLSLEKSNFQREVPESEVTKLRKQLEDEQSKRAPNELFPG